MRINYYQKIAKSDSVTRTFYPPKYANLKQEILERGSNEDLM
jgi:hypothetical protein